MSTDSKSIDWYNKNAEGYTKHVRNPQDSIYHSLYEKPAMYSLILRARAEQLYSRRKFLAGSAKDLPFDDATFDAIISVFVWLYVEDISTAAKELARVLTPQRRFVIVTANPGLYSLWQTWFSDFVIEGKKCAEI